MGIGLRVRIEERMAAFCTIMRIELLLRSFALTETSKKTTEST